MVPGEFVVHVREVLIVRVYEVVPLRVGHLDSFAFELEYRCGSVASRGGRTGDRKARKGKGATGPGGEGERAVGGEKEEGPLKVHCATVYRQQWLY